MNKRLPPVTYLRELFLYKPRTGELFWKRRPREHFADRKSWCMWNTRYAGQKAFVTKVKGYCYASVDGVRYVAHRVVWKMVTGKEPSAYLDHKNRSREDNRFNNLREVTQSQNGFNRAKRSAINKAGRIGIYYKKSRGHWYAYISQDYKQKFLGSFASKRAAISCRREAERGSL